MMLLTFAVWILLIFIGVHIGYSLMLASLFFFIISGQTSLFFFACKEMLGSINNSTLLAVPFFVLAGNIMNGGGVTERIFRFARAMVGHRKGGLAHVNVLASLVFSGMSGSALADAGGLGQLEIKSMRDAGYDSAFSGGITAASCILGPLVPPSTSMIIYAVSSDQSVEKMFLAGFLPGLLIAGTLMIMCSIMSHRRNYPADPKASVKEKWESFKGAALALLTPILILTGIFTGIFTPTEAAVIAVFYTTFLGFFVYKELTLKKFFDIVLDSVKTTGTIVMMILGVGLFGWIIAREQMPLHVAQAFMQFVHNPLMLMLMINILLLFLGMFIDALPLLIILVPILLPTVIAAGIDPIHFGIVVIFNLMIGILTPPMGTALFVVARVGNIPFNTLVKGTVPFLIPLLISLVLLSAFPQICLFIPGLFS